MGIELTRLFVPLVPGDLESVVASNGLELPSRLGRDHLVVSLGYVHAMALARGQAAVRETGSASLLVKVEVVSDYLRRLEPRVVGRGSSVELWIPAAQIPALNRRIARPMRLLHALYGPAYGGRAMPGHSMFGDDIQLFLMLLEQAPALRPVPLVPLTERYEERIRGLRRRQVADLRRMLAADRRAFSSLRRELEALGVAAARDALLRSAGFEAGLAPRTEGWDDRLLRAGRFWLLSNLAFWRVTGKVGRRRLAALGERLERTFPHPAPTLRGTLLD